MFCLRRIVFGFVFVRAVFLYDEFLLSLVLVNEVIRLDIDSVLRDMACRQHVSNEAFPNEPNELI